MKKIKQLIKLISIIVLFTIPASCDLVTEPITIENGVNVGSCDITLRYDRFMNVTNVTDSDFDVIVPNLEHVGDGWARIGAFQTGTQGLNGRIILADVTFNKTADVGDICSLIGITVTTLKDATPEGNPIPHTVEGCAIIVSALTTPTEPNEDKDDGGGGIIHTPTPSPTPTASPATPSAATTPAEEEKPVETTAQTPTPTPTTPSLPSPILSPIAAIVIVVIVAVFGIIRVIGITAQTEDETYAEAIASIKQAECKKAITAIIGIVVVAVVAIIAIMLMM